MSIVKQFSPSTSFDAFPQIKLTWNRNEEVYRILELASLHREWLTGSVHERPPSGTQLLFSRAQVDFKNDGYEWTRRKDGRLIREDHMKLKVKKVDVLLGNYSHSAVVPTFHRRVYSLITNPDIVLVHYLKSEEVEDCGIAQLAARISDSLKKNGIHPNLSQLLAQMEPILFYMDKSDVHMLAQEVLENMRRDAESKLNRRNSCSSASRRGLSSVILARQPSAFSDSVETQFIPRSDYKEWNEKNNGIANGRDGEHSRSHSGDTGHSSDEVTDWSKIDGPVPSASEWSTINSDWSAPMHKVQSTSRATTNTLTMCPNVASNRGGERILIVGGWFVRGNNYSVAFGEKRVRAVLIQDGVIQATAPAVPGSGKICVRVFSGDTLIGSPLDFFYNSCSRDSPTRQYLIQALVDRVQLLCASFNVTVEGPIEDDSIISVVDSLRGRPLVFPSLLNSSMPSRNILHLTAALDFHELLQRLLYLRSELPRNLREFDIHAKDLEGDTPLSIALSNRKGRCSMILANEAGWSMDDLERESEKLRSENVSMRGTLSVDEEASCHREEDDDMCDGPSRSTEAWIMSHGESMIDGRERTRGEEMGRVPLEISMDTEVLVPDSPTMANLFHAVTSPGIVNDYARDQMATLTRRLIDALPTNVKMANGVIDQHPHQHTHIVYANCPPMGHEEVPMTNGTVEYQTDPCMGVTYGHSLNDAQMQRTAEDFGYPIYMEPNSFYHMIPSTSTADHMSISALDIELEDKDLGDFLSGSNELSLDVDPLQKKLETLKLNPKEQRDVFEAALVMQRSSFGGSSPTECERSAARTIQTCYRRYKQYCYLRRLHNAAVVVQKHFRLRRANQKEETHDEVQEHPSMQGESICIQVPNRSLSREHRAAATIQNAYRGHRKRQKEDTAARRIQKHWRANRQKLRKMQEVNGGVCTVDGTLSNL